MLGNVTQRPQSSHSNSRTPGKPQVIRPPCPIYRSPPAPTWEHELPQEGPLCLRLAPVTPVSASTHLHTVTFVMHSVAGYFLTAVPLRRWLFQNRDVISVRGQQLAAEPKGTIHRNHSGKHVVTWTCVASWARLPTPCCDPGTCSSSLINAHSQISSHTPRGPGSLLQSHTHLHTQRGSHVQEVQTPHKPIFGFLGRVA